MLLYPLAYAVVWTLPTAIRIYQTISGQPAPWQIQTADKACIVLQGFVDAVIYGATESCVSSWRNLLFPGKFRSGEVRASTVIPQNLGDSSKAKRKQDSAHIDDRQLVSTPSSRDATSLATVDGSVNSLDNPGTLEAPRDSESSIELGDLNRGLPIMGIQKTVEIEVRSNDGVEGQQTPQWPPKTYFPTRRDSSRK